MQQPQPFVSSMRAESCICAVRSVHSFNITARKLKKKIVKRSKKFPAFCVILFLCPTTLLWVNIF